MQLKKLAALAKGRWKSLMAVAVLGLVLAPMPAFGFTFLTDWQFFVTSTYGPAHAPITSSNDVPGGASSLFVDMNVAPQAPKLTDPGGGSPTQISYVTAVRTFHVTGTENIQIGRSFQTLLQGAQLSMFVYVKGLAAGDTTRVNVGQDVNLRAGIKFPHLYTMAPTLNTIQLGEGDYSMNIVIRYRKNRLGFWDNSSPKPGSPHSFSFQSI